MSEYPKVAVLMAAYNGKEWIKEQITSILHQKNITVDIYISVDLSTDGTHELVKLLSLSYENITVLPYGARFGGAAPNFFRLIKDVDLSAYDYVSLADQDDIWNEDKLFSACCNMSSRRYDVYSSNVVAFWEDGSSKLIDKSQSQCEFDYLFESAGPGCTFVFSREFSLELKIKLIDLGSEIKKIWLHDWFTYSFARTNNYKWFVDEVPSMKYRQHSDNQVGTNIGLNAMIKRVKLMLSGEGFKQVLIQSRALNQEELKPVRLLETNTRFSFFKLAFLCRQCRRKPTEQFFFLILCLLMCIKGPIKYD